MSINSIPKARHEGQGVTQPTRRDHPTAGVVDGGRVVQSPAVAIEGFGGGKPKNVQTEFSPHPSTTRAQLSGRGFSVDSRKLPPAPVVANDGTGKPTVAPPVSWGMDAAPRRHKAADGDAVLLEALPSGSVYPRERPHSCVTNGKPVTED
jgi:hypothetical protein